MEFWDETSTTSAAAFRSFPQKGQNLSVSATSRLQLGQLGCKLHLQLGQKLKRAPTMVEQRGQENGSGSRTWKYRMKPMAKNGQDSSMHKSSQSPPFIPRRRASRYTYPRAINQMLIIMATRVMIPANARDAIAGWPAKAGGKVSPLTPERFISVPKAMATSHSTTQVQISHFGTIFISSRKRNLSLFLRNRISFMRSSNASLMRSSFSKVLSRLWLLGPCAC